MIKYLNNYNIYWPRLRRFMDITLCRMAQLQLQFDQGRLPPLASLTKLTAQLTSGMQRALPLRYSKIGTSRFTGSRSLISAAIWSSMFCSRRREMVLRGIAKRGAAMLLLARAVLLTLRLGMKARLPIWLLASRKLVQARSYFLSSQTALNSFRTSFPMKQSELSTKTTNQSSLQCDSAAMYRLSTSLLTESSACTTTWYCSCTFRFTFRSLSRQTRFSLCSCSSCSICCRAGVACSSARSTQTTWKLLQFCISSDFRFSRRPSGECPSRAWTRRQKGSSSQSMMLYLSWQYSSSSLARSEKLSRSSLRMPFHFCASSSCSCVTTSLATLAGSGSICRLAMSREQVDRCSMMSWAMLLRMEKIILAQAITRKRSTTLNVSRYTQRYRLKCERKPSQLGEECRSRCRREKDAVGWGGLFLQRLTHYSYSHFISCELIRLQRQFIVAPVDGWIDCYLALSNKIKSIIQMKISHDKASLLVRDFYYPDLATRKCVHAVTFLCWFAMIFIGTTIIGVGTSNSSLSYPFCDDSLAFCTQNILVEASTVLYFYVRLTHYHQNNRMFMDFYSNAQLHGQVDNTAHCGNYYTYGSLNLVQTAGGYRTASAAQAHPCGEVMATYASDLVFLVDGQGSTPKLDNGDLVSSFNQGHFFRLSQYQLSQWADVQSTQFVNYFTVAATGTKYSLVGKAAVTPGNYQVVMQNNYLTKGKFSKELLITEVGVLGATNHVLGFSVFAYGLFLLFFHVYVCFKWRK